MILYALRSTHILYMIYLRVAFVFASFVSVFRAEVDRCIGCRRPFED